MIHNEYGDLLKEIIDTPGRPCTLTRRASVQQAFLLERGGASYTYDVKLAKPYCQVCPVVQKCWWYGAVSGERGVWGGTDHLTHDLNRARLDRAELQAQLQEGGAAA